MDFKEIKNTKHYLYDDIDEINELMPGGVVRHNWRHREEGECVYTENFISGSEPPKPATKFWS